MSHACRNHRCAPEEARPTRETLHERQERQQPLPSKAPRSPAWSPPAANRRLLRFRQSACLSRLYGALPTAEDFAAGRGRYQYGRRGTPTTEALESALQELEGPECAGVVLVPSGLAAISSALLSVVKAGDHLLVTDSAYEPTRKFCEHVLTRFGVTTTYYDPLIGATIAEHSARTPGPFI